LVATVTGILILHFALLATYCLSGGGSKASIVSASYINPFFHQSCALFAPPPQSNYHLYITNNTGEVVDLLNEAIYKHRQYRFNGWGPVIITFVNSIHYFEKNSSLQSQMNGPVKNDLNFMMFQQSVQNYAASMGFGRVDRFTLLVQDAESSRIYIN
jgi:hypothetical protein